MATSATGTLTEQIRQLDLKIAARRHRIKGGLHCIRGGLTSLHDQIRAKLGSPLMMIGAFSTGFVLGRTRVGHGSRSARREQPHPDVGVLERVVVAIAVLRTWMPMVRGVARWFERPAKAPLDVGAAGPSMRPAEHQPHHPSPSNDTPGAATQRYREVASERPRQ